MKTLLLSRMLLVSLLSWSWHVQAAPTREILSQRDCFAEFQSYDEWMDHLWKKYSIRDYLLARWHFAKSDFSRYRRELDCRSIAYRSDQYVVHAWLVQPKNGRKSSKLPVIIYNRGGNRQFGKLSFGDLFTYVFPFAAQGYLVVASQYRGADLPLDAKSSPDQFGGDDVRDVTNLVRIASGLPRADPRKFFMIGQSRGAIMTFLALRDTALPIRAVAIYSGLYDMHDLLRLRPAGEQLFEVLIPDYRKHKKAELDRRSVTLWADRLPAQTGVLILHGSDDERAPLASARKLAGKLGKIGRPHKIVVYSGESHYLGGVRPQVRAQTLLWFKKFQWRSPRETLQRVEPDR